jgi:hypothetical protein
MGAGPNSPHPFPTHSTAPSAARLVTVRSRARAAAAAAPAAAAVRLAVVGVVGGPLPPCRQTGAPPANGRVRRVR